MSWEHPLLDPGVVAEIERAASEHRGCPWVSQGFTSLDERSSHPCGILHGQPFSVFAKLSAATDACGQFAAELAGLRLLSRAARVPTPVARGLAEVPHGWLLLTEALPERLPPDREARDWRSIGQVLAALHQVKHRQFGLDRGGYFGPLSQDNRPVPSGSWPDFYRERRITPLLRTARDTGHLPADLAVGLGRIMDQLPDLCGPEPQPSLLHGDAQQNNFVTTVAGAVVIDPSPYFGHPEMDLAMVDFFQPVPADVLDGYRDTATIASGFADRKELWRLYAYLAVVTVDRQYLTRLADAIRRYR